MNETKRMERIEKAKAHTEEMERRYSDKIAECIRNSVIYGPERDIVIPKSESMDRHTSLVDADTVTALLSLQKRGYGKIAVLNFASWKWPGGGFSTGAMAQEEALCHASFLFNVLNGFPEYYEWNREHKGRNMYHNKAIYSPNVVFEQGSLKGKADVITCAAPNVKAARNYQEITDEENLSIFTDRAKFVAKICLDQHVDTVILGAWGCGVFGQDPTMVASILNDVFSHSDIAHVKFAVPRTLDEKNYLAFERELRING